MPLRARRGVWCACWKAPTFMRTSFREKPTEVLMPTVAPVAEHLIPPNGRSFTKRRVWNYNDIDHQVYTEADMVAMTE